MKTKIIFLLGTFALGIYIGAIAFKLKSTTDSVEVEKLRVILSEQQGKILDLKESMRIKDVENLYLDDIIRDIEGGEKCLFAWETKFSDLNGNLLRTSTLLEKTKRELLMCRDNDLE